jgi:large subunit ribosomal protein L2
MHKQLFRNIDFSNSKTTSVVVAICYDPARTSFISINFDLIKREFFHTLATKANFPGSILMSDHSLNDLRLGYRTNIKNIAPGSLVHCISQNEKQIGVYAKSAGSFGQILQTTKEYAKIKLPSNKIVSVSVNSFATLGIVSNEKHNLVYIGKAGINRHKGIRPSVRGIAMNPVDHPHGGRTNGGKPSVTPWGLPTKGKFYLRKKKKNYE